jgi:hypothetical protein
MQWFCISWKVTAMRVSILNFLDRHFMTLLHLMPQFTVFFRIQEVNISQGKGDDWLLERLKKKHYLCGSYNERGFMINIPNHIESVSDISYFCYLNQLHMMMMMIWCWVSYNLKEPKNIHNWNDAMECMSDVWTQFLTWIMRWGVPI